MFQSTEGVHSSYVAIHYRVFNCEYIRIVYVYLRTVGSDHPNLVLLLHALNFT